MPKTIEEMDNRIKVLKSEIGSIEYINRTIKVVAAEIKAVRSQQPETIQDSIKQVDTLIRLSLEKQQHLRDLYDLISP